MSFQRGSTLILALLIVSIVSSMAFAAGQLFVSEARIAGTLEDTNTAYYAAESGIDRGISEFKRDRNQQICQGGGNCTASSTAQTQTPLSNAANYDIKMWYLGCVVGDTNNDCRIDSTDLYSQKAFIIPKDASVLLDVSKVACINGIYPNCPGGTGDINLYFRFIRNNQNNLSDQDSTIEIKGLTSNATGVRIITNPPGQAGSRFIQPSQVNPICNIFNPNPCLAVENILFELKRYENSITDQSQFTALQIKFFSQDLSDKLIFGLQPKTGNSPANNLLIDTGRTTIESVGTFGRVKRKLQAQIDRTSGTLIGIFDFTLFSQTGIQ